ncbi:MAG: hypothetical protein U0457_18820 [Candidatus Sericytochromatia bacterium]
MDKNKILNLYLDFINGKFLSSNDRINFTDRFNHLKKFVESNTLTWNFENTNDRDNIVTVSYIDNKVHPELALELASICYHNFYKKEPKKIYSNIIDVLYHINYYQAYSKNPPKNDDIYIVSNNIYDYFSKVEIPNDITLNDIKFKRNLPALFIFENNNMLDYIDNYLFPNSDKVQLMDCIFNYNTSKPHYPGSLILRSSDENFYKNISINDYIIKAQIPSNLIDHCKVLYNILLFLSNKDTLDYKSEELNPNILTSLENIEKGRNVNRNTLLLKQLPSYRFIDLSLTLENYSNEYHKKNPNLEQSAKTPHWRSAHWHTFWKGKRDGSEERKKELKFIPMTWVGNPELKSDIISFKVIK